MRRTILWISLFLLFLLSACGGSGGDSGGGGGTAGTGTPGPAAVFSYHATSASGTVETSGGKPVIRLFGTTGCPHSAYLGDMFDRVAREYVAAGKVVAIHWQLDTGDDVLTTPIETAVPAGVWTVFDEFSPDGSVPAD